MSDPLRDPILAALAILRAQLQADPDSAKALQTKIETISLEVTTNDDPAAVVRALALVAAEVLTASSRTSGVDPLRFVDQVERRVRGDGG